MSDITLFLSGVASIWLYMTALFLFCILKKDNSWADVAWGIGFVLLAWHYYYWTDHPPTPRQLLVNILVTIWGLRLAWHIGSRHLKSSGEDFRYKKWREDWGKTWVWRSYLQVFLLQGAIMIMIALPIYFINISEVGTLGFVDMIGTIAFIFGFYWEAVSDYQLRQFKNDPTNKGKVMDKGLWRYSRHPNYFGEAVLWWGIYIIALCVQMPWFAVAFLSPGLITFLLMNVSGVPMLERKYKDRPDYQAYIRNTSAFFPAPPKSK